MSEPRFRGILVLAHDNMLTSDQDIFIFWARHSLTGPIEFRAAMRKAFTEWKSGHKLGRDYVTVNGCNWGDAINIPGQILRRHGIASFVCLEEPGENRHGGSQHRLVPAAYDHKLIVDHNEHLVDD